MNVCRVIKDKCYFCFVDAFQPLCLRRIKYLLRSRTCWINFPPPHVSHCTEKPTPPIEVTILPLLVSLWIDPRTASQRAGPGEKGHSLGVTRLDKLEEMHYCKAERSVIYPPNNPQMVAEVGFEAMPPKRLDTVVVVDDQGWGSHAHARVRKSHLQLTHDPGNK